ncbi:hypothetical protein SALBM311S_08991 [Streptomyces alboniger]
MSSTQLTSVADLPAIEDFITFDNFSRNFVEAAWELRGREGTDFLRGPMNSLVVLRNKDARTLAANPALGNVPADIVLWMATEADLGSGPVTKPDPEQTEGYGRFLRNQAFTSNPPLHQPYRNLLVRNCCPGTSSVSLPPPHASHRNLSRSAPGATGPTSPGSSPGDSSPASGPSNSG